MPAALSRRSLPARLIAALALTALGGCAAAPAAAPEAWAWADDPAVRGAPYLLLGEVHDNPEHHRQRAALLARLLADGRPTTVVFEQMTRDRDADIVRAAALGPAADRADRVAEAGGLTGPGWGWPLHRPLLQAALDGGARVAGGNLPREQMRPIVREGLAAVPADLRPALAGMPWAADQQAVLAREIADGHCGMLPPDRVAPMVLAQRARDAALAAAMTSARAGAPRDARVVLIAGNGHVRTDVGVPAHLRAAGVPAADIAVLRFEESAAPAGAGERVVTTPPAPRDDPCAGMRPVR